MRIENVYQHFKAINHKLQINSQIIIAYHVKKFLVRVRKARLEEAERLAKEVKSVKKKKTDNSNSNAGTANAKGKGGAAATSRQSTNNRTSVRSGGPKSLKDPDSVSVTPKDRTPPPELKSQASLDKSAKELKGLPKDAKKD